MQSWDHAAGSAVVALAGGAAEQVLVDRMPASESMKVAGLGGLGLAAIGAAVKLFGPKRSSATDVVGDALLASGVTVLGQTGTAYVDANVLHVAPSGQTLQAVIVEEPAGTTFTPPSGTTVVEAPTYAQATYSFEDEG
ncbi:MAG: hypothetical protein M0Z47_10800 [Actinomycetota bacterium]|nr:hypothetical protein [Actinomycetota bacterium]